jgi:hypothetical protein
MRILIRPSKDSSIYSARPTTNSGLDEILEIGKVLGESVRSLIDFDIGSALEAPPTAKYFLNLRIANSSNLEFGSSVEIHRISGSWVEGSGYFYQERRNSRDGVTWNDASISREWELGGGDYYPNPIAQSLVAYPLNDFRVDVTDLVAPVISSSLAYEEDPQNDVPDWNGLLLKFSDAVETDSENVGFIKLFSNQTHTIYSPTLEIAWDDSVFITGSKTRDLPSAPNNISISPKGVREEYNKGSKQLVELNVRDQYPGKNFDSTPRFKSKYHLPLTSYYSITDLQANVVIYPYDEYSKISTNSFGSYFMLDTSYLYEGRRYGVDIKVESPDGSQIVIKNLFSFWVK